MYWTGESGVESVDSLGPLIAHLIVLALEVWYVVVPVLRWWNTIYILTDRRVQSHWGILYKHSREIDLQRIASISEERGILDRIFGCGTLNFYDAAETAQPKKSGFWNKENSQRGVRFVDVPRIKEVRELVEKARYAARDGNGLGGY